MLRGVGFGEELRWPIRSGDGAGGVWDGLEGQVSGGRYGSPTFAEFSSGRWDSEGLCGIEIMCGLVVCLKLACVNS